MKKPRLVLKKDELEIFKLKNDHATKISSLNYQLAELMLKNKEKELEKDHLRQYKIKAEQYDKMLHQQLLNKQKTDHAKEVHAIR